MRQTILAVLSLLAAAAVLTGCGGDYVLLTSAGPVAQGQSDLMMTAIYVMLLVVVPSIVMAVWFGWKFRKSNKNADYQPQWTHSTAIEVVVWGVPIIIIAYLAFLSFKGTHEYDPYKSRSADPSQDLVIQVIAEQFKWIFVYPEQQIATVNEVRFPEKQPVSFRITSNFAMTSFFIPKLSGQIYAMAGMQTRLHMIADSVSLMEVNNTDASDKKDAQFGYRGFAANYAGYGFSQMHFRAHSVSQADFDQWVSDIKNGQGDTYIVKPDGTKAIQKGALDWNEFTALRDGNRSQKQIDAMVKTAKTATEIKARDTAVREGPYPTKPHPVTYYSSVDADLFKRVIDQYMSNFHEQPNSSTTTPVVEQHDDAANAELEAAASATQGQGE